MAKSFNAFDDDATRKIVDMVKREAKRAQHQNARWSRRPTAYKFIRLFELTETLSAGGTANATLVRWDTDAEDWVVGSSPDDDFEVIAFISSMAGADGTRGIAANLFGKWVIIQLDCE